MLRTLLRKSLGFAAPSAPQRTREPRFAVSRRGDLRFPADNDVRVLLIGMGQSLGAGSRGVPARTVSPVSLKVEMPDIGIDSDIRVGNPASYGGDRVEALDASRIVGFMSAVARKSVRSPLYGETGLNRLGNAMFETVAAELAFEPRICAWTIAQGGATYRQIRKGTQTWSNGLAILERVVELTRLERRRPYLPFIFWRHGESDQASLDYEANLHELYQDVQDDYKPILGQASDIPIILVQSSSFVTGRAALAMLDAVEAAPDRFFLSHPSYPLTHSPDHVHLASDGYVLDGEYAWRSARAFLSPKGWTGYRPIREGVMRDGAIIRVPMHVPQPPIRLERGPLGEHPDTTEGFTARTLRTGRALSVVAVEADGAVVRVRLAEDPGEQVWLNYALAGQSSPRRLEMRPRGSLADSAEPANFALHFRVLTPS